MRAGLAGYNASLFQTLVSTADCILGVGKTSLLKRYIQGKFDPDSTSSTVGANFLAKRILDVDSGTTVRLQLWDTAGQERFHSITRLYYRGASAIILAYNVTDYKSFEDMGRWLREMKENMGEDVVLHVVGTKTDLVAQDPSLRQVAFEKCIAFVGEHMYPDKVSTPPAVAENLDEVWDCCHEISASTGEGIEEVFRVITRKLVEQNQRKIDIEQMQKANALIEGNIAASFDNGIDGRGSFRVGIGDKRRSWLGLTASGASGGEEMHDETGPNLKPKRKGCC